MDLETIEIDDMVRARRERFHVGLGKLRAHNKALAKLQVEDRIAKRNKNMYRKAEITAALRLMRVIKGMPLTREIIPVACSKCGHLDELAEVKTVDIHNLPPEGVLLEHATERLRWMVEEFDLYKYMSPERP